MRDDSAFNASFNESESLNANFQEEQKFNAGFNEALVVETGDYNNLNNKPKINGVELKNDKTFEELGVETLTNLQIKALVDRVFGGE